MSRVLDVALPGRPYARTPGPDGDIWVTPIRTGEVARIAPGGGVDVHPVHTDSKPSTVLRRNP